MSEVSKPLPLFRLPAIPLTKISRYMHLREILLITLASKKSAFIMKSLLPLNSFYLQMRFSLAAREIFFGTKGPWDPVTIKIQTEDDIFKLQVTQPSGDVSYQWAGLQLQEPVGLLLTHFATVFKPTISIHVEKIYSQEFLIGVINQVKQLNLVRKSIILHRVNLSPENYKFILEECKEATELLIHCKVAPDFEYRVGPDFRVDHFSVSDGRWMHLEDFTNCKTINIYENPNYINPEVLRTLIKKWVESDCRLKHLKVNGSSVGIDFSELLTGIEHTTTEQTGEPHSVEITRKRDGKKALVKCHRGDFELKVID
ncbi:hypothetical protein CRE_04198 [Caenorhabditis remanei]|uniref:F-box domain-containing protein n=1 Tax=Caenorhabditis remanei TaxID=31234 RepID=E3MYY8_CAERE|nr:hypothetical protein CRE_04198 [Caenorhabditis remanei]